MKTIAEFKRALSVGTLVHTTHHQTSKRDPETGKIVFSDTDMGTRPVSVLKSTQVGFLTERGTVSWLQWPKASECIIEGNQMTVLGPDWRTDQGHERGNEPLIKLLTYTIQ